MLKRKRWRRLIGPGFFVLLLLGLSLAIACYSTPEEKITKAKEELKQSVFEEKRYPLYDNGKNFFFVEENGWAEAMVILQEWIDSHPEKEIVQAPWVKFQNTEGWLVYYRDKNCPLTSAK